jgi:Cys-rich protein (TIGR04453 family)
MLSILYSLYLILVSVFQDKTENLQDTCHKNCGVYVSCARDLKTDFRLKEEAFRKEIISCNNLCNKEQADFMDCFKEEMNTCEVKYFCVQKLYKQKFIDKRSN